jgi:hypothetical protein
MKIHTLMAALAAIFLGFGNGHTLAVTLGPTVVISQGLIPIGANLTPQYTSDIDYAMENNLASYGSWMTIMNGATISITNIFAFNSAGRAQGFAVSITSTTPFQFGELTVALHSPYTSSSNTFAGRGYTLELLGGRARSYGPDGIPGTADDVVYTTGTPTSINNYSGLIGAYSIQTSGYSTDPAIAAAKALDNWSTLAPFTMTATSGFGLTFGSISSTYSAPEPSALALVGLALGARLLHKRKK